MERARGSRGVVAIVAGMLRAIGAMMMDLGNVMEAYLAERLILEGPPSEEGRPAIYEPVAALDAADATVLMNMERETLPYAGSCKATRRHLAGSAHSTEDGPGEQAGQSQMTQPGQGEGHGDRRDRNSKEVFGQFWAKARNRSRSAVANLRSRALALRDRSEENEADVEPANYVAGAEAMVIRSDSDVEPNCDGKRSSNATHWMGRWQSNPLTRPWEVTWRNG